MIIRFASGSDQFELPQAALAASFDYFKRMLKHDARLSFSEKTEGVVKFHDTVSGYDFGILITWLQTGLVKLPQDDSSALAACISSIIAADYLGISNAAGYIGDMGERFAERLVANRMALSAENLQLIQQHKDLLEKKARPILTFAARAAVRPFLTAQRITIPGQATTEQMAVAVHYQGLMANNAMYAADVMIEVRQTLLNGHRQNDVALRGATTLGEGSPVSTKYKCFDLVRYWDPLIQFSKDYESAAAFTI